MINASPLNTPSSIFNPIGDRTRRAFVKVISDLRQIILKTQDTSARVTAQSALSSLIGLRYNGTVPNDIKNHIARRLVDRGQTTWLDYGALTDAEQNRLIHDNLWIVEIEL